MLHARPHDDGGMWPALAARRREALPTKLHWAAVLLDPDSPQPMTCTEAQVRELFHWLDALPNTERVSIACQRRTPTGQPAERDARPPGSRPVATYDPVRAARSPVPVDAVTRANTTQRKETGYESKS